MLHSLAPARPFQGREVHRVPHVGPSVQCLDRARDQRPSRAAPLDRYLEGWAETDLDKIMDATAPGYRFTDPFIGSFSGQSLHKYFDLLQDRLSRTGTISRFDLAFFLRGPMERRSNVSGVQFWREAPRIGLTGIAEIEIGEQGIMAECVAYDGNLASDTLCRRLSLSFGVQF